MTIVFQSFHLLLFSFSPSNKHLSLLTHCDEYIVEKVSEVDEFNNNYRKKSLTDECTTTMHVAAAVFVDGDGVGGDVGDDHKEATLSMANNTTTLAAPCGDSNARQSIVMATSASSSPSSLSSAPTSSITSSPRTSINNLELVETSNNIVSISFVQRDVLPSSIVSNSITLFPFLRPYLRAPL